MRSQKRPTELQGSPPAPTIDLHMPAVVGLPSARREYLDPSTGVKDPSAVTAALVEAACLLTRSEASVVDPQGRFEAQGIKVLTIPHLADRVACAGGPTSAQIALYDKVRGCIVFDQQYLQQAPHVPPGLRSDFIAAALGEALPVGAKNSVSRALLTGNGSCVYEPIGHEGGLVGVTRPTATSTVSAAKPSKSALTKLDKALQKGLAPLDGLKFTTSTELPTPFVFDGAKGELVVDRSLAQLSTQQVAALCSFAVLMRECASRIWASSRTDRLGRGFVDVAMRLLRNKELCTSVSEGVKALQGLGWDTTGLDGMLESVHSCAGSPSVKRFLEYNTGMIASEMATKRLQAYSFVVNRVIRPTAACLLGNARRPDFNPLGFVRQDTLFAIADRTPAVAVEEIAQTITSQRPYSMVVNFCGTLMRDRFKQLFTLYTPQELNTLRSSSEVQGILRAIDAPGATYGGSDELNLQLKSAFKSIEWLRVSLGADWQEPLKNLPTTKLRIEFLTRLDLPDWVGTHVGLADDRLRSGSTAAERPARIADLLQTPGASSRDGMLGETLNKRGAVNVLTTLMSGLKQCQEAENPRILEATNTTRKLLVKRGIFLVAEQLWTDQPSALARALLTDRETVAEVVAEREQELIAGEELLTESALILKSAQLRAPGALESKLSSVIRAAPVGVFDEPIDASSAPYPLHRAALRYSLATPGTASYEAAFERLEAMLTSDAVPGASVPQYLSRVLRIERSERSVRLALRMSSRRSSAEMAGVGLAGSDIAAALSELPREHQERLTQEIFPTKERLAEIDRLYPSPLIKHALLKGLPEDVRARFVNELSADQQQSVLSGIKDQSMIRHVADSSESRLAGNALLYRHAYERCVESLPTVLSTILMRKPVPNLYALLGVTKRASVEDVRKSGKMLQMLFHPDRNVGEEGAEERFKEIVSALEILGDRDKRAEYDKTLPMRAELFPTANWMSLIPRV